MAISNLGLMLLKEEIKTVETEVVEEEVSALLVVLRCSNVIDTKCL